MTSERDQVVREIFGTGVTYGNLSGPNQTVVTNEGNAAFYQVTEWLQWYTLINPATTDAPASWNEAFRAVWVSNLKRLLRSPQEFNAHWTTYVAPLMRRIADHYTADWNSTSTLASDNFTVQLIRQSAISIVVRQRTPIFPPISEVDRIIREEFVSLWNARPWNFRRKPLRLTITEDGDVEASGGFVFDGMASKTFVIQTDNGSQDCDWIDSTQAAEALARYDGETGVPLFFYDIDSGTAKQIVFFPMPDKDYVAFATILIGAPQFGNAAATTGLDNLPVEFRGLLRDIVVAKIVNDWGREDNDATRLLARIERTKTQLTAAWDSKGASRSTARPHHMSRMINSMMSADGSNILGQGC